LSHCRGSSAEYYEPGQVGIAGSQTGTGLLTVADWWLAIGRAVDEETEAAAAPAKTIDKAMMRIVSFIVGNLSDFWLTRKRLLVGSVLNFNIELNLNLSVR
jgi:hypothetical protein